MKYQTRIQKYIAAQACCSGRSEILGEPVALLEGAAPDPSRMGCKLEMRMAAAAAARAVPLQRAATRRG